MSIDDPLGAFCQHSRIQLEGSGRGPLLGLSFGVKDVFDIAGYRTGNGHPIWLGSHPPAQRTASAVERLLAAGARMIGKTHSDEMAFALNGENVHYGTPINPKAPGRIPGGSSSGSAAAVAGNLVDFALGTDCGGSVRLPASYCGIYGFRPTHGLVPADGVVPLAASFDTVGFFAREASLIRRIGEVLLPAAPPLRLQRVVAAADAGVAAAITAALAPGIARLISATAHRADVKVYCGEPAQWANAFRILQGAEFWAQHGAWIACHQPHFGPGINERIAWTRTIDHAATAAEARKRQAIASHLDALLGNDSVICLPTGPGIAPKLNTPVAELESFRAAALSLLSIAGLARLPQINLPVGTLHGCPIGLSIIGPRGSDRALLDFVAAHFA